MLAIIAIPAGLLIGLSLGALGGGGSILTVPALVYLLHQQPHAATTASLLIVGITALAGMAAHWRAGRVRLAQGITFGVLGMPALTPAACCPRASGLTCCSPCSPCSCWSPRQRWCAASGQSPPQPAPAAAATSPGSPPTGGIVRPVRSAPRHPARRWSRRWTGSARPRASRVADTPEPAARGRRMSTPAAWRALKVAAAATGVGLLTGFFGVGGGFVIGAGPGACPRVRDADRRRYVPAGHLRQQRRGARREAWRERAPGLAADRDVHPRRARRDARRQPRRLSRGAAKLTAAFTVLLIVVAAYTLSRSLPA